MAISMEDVRAACELSPGLFVRLAASQRTDCAGLRQMIAWGEADFDLESWSTYDRRRIVRMRIQNLAAMTRRRMGVRWQPQT